MNAKAFFLLILACSISISSLAAYELAELDGDEIAGNAPVLLGWEERYVPLSWAIIEGNNPPTVTFTQFRQAVENAFNTWQNVESSFVAFRPANEDGAVNGVIQLNMTSTASAYSPFRTTDGRRGPPYDDGFHNVVAYIDSGWQTDFGFSSAALGVTWFAYNLSERRLVGADIFLNGENVTHPWGIVDPAAPLPTEYDLENTITHEVGHFIGLAHPYADGRIDSTMYFAATVGETHKRSLAVDDINGATYLYPMPGVPLIPPDTNVEGLRASLENPVGGGGCAVSETRNFLPWTSLCSASVCPPSWLSAPGAKEDFVKSCNNLPPPFVVPFER